MIPKKGVLSFERKDFILPCEVPKRGELCLPRALCWEAGVPGGGWVCISFPEISVPGTFSQGITFSKAVVYALIAYKRDFCTHSLVFLLGFSNAITHPALCTAATSAAVCCIVKIKRFNVNPNT